MLAAVGAEVSLAHWQKKLLAELASFRQPQGDSSVPNCIVSLSSLERA